LGYRRDRRDLIVASEFATDSISYFNDKWVDQSLTASVKVVGDFKVRSSRGKLSQVFDNLALNSEYWMKQNLAAGRAESGTLVIEISTPFIMFSDSGVGIDPGVEELLFDPFVTRKPREVGRGLGLFVVQQLLVSENVAISLDPDRNQFGNRFRFRLDFSAII
jgi:signal transduction histidine kinase